MAATCRITDLIESGQMSVELTSFDLKSVIRQVAAIYKPLAAESGIEFSLILDDSLKDGYIGDGERIKQILNNLLDRKSTRLNSSHQIISYAVFCLKKKKIEK